MSPVTGGAIQHIKGATCLHWATSRTTCFALQAQKPIRTLYWYEAAPRLHCRPMVQVPVGYSPLAVVHSIPGIGNGELMLNAAVLSAIFQCQVQNWNDASIASLNPNIT